MYYSPVEVNGKWLSTFVLFQSVCQGCLLSPLLYVLMLEPLLSQLRDRTGCTALDGISVSGGTQARVFVYTSPFLYTLLYRLLHFHVMSRQHGGGTENTRLTTCLLVWS